MRKYARVEAVIDDRDRQLEHKIRAQLRNHWIGHDPRHGLTRIELVKHPESFGIVESSRQRSFVVPELLYRLKPRFKVTSFEIVEKKRDRKTQQRVTLTTTTHGERLVPLWFNQTGRRQEDLVNGRFSNNYCVLVQYTLPSKVFRLMRYDAQLSANASSVDLRADHFFEGSLAALQETHPSFYEAALSAIEKVACEPCTHCHFFYWPNDPWRIFIPPRSTLGWSIQRSQRGHAGRQWLADDTEWTDTLRYAALFTDYSTTQQALSSLISRIKSSHRYSPS